MRRWVLFFLLAGFLAACSKKKEAEDVYSVQVKQYDDRAAEAFKVNYTIQFPNGYTGGLIQGFEGNLFDKRVAGDNVRVWYNFCNSLFCPQFGNPLADTTQTSLTVSFYYTTDLTVKTLSRRIEFMKNNERVGILYYNAESISFGRLFWKENNIFQEAADVVFRKNELNEVITILRTIKEE